MKRGATTQQVLKRRRVNDTISQWGEIIEDPLYQIFSNLGVTDLLNASETNKYWHHAVVNFLTNITSGPIHLIKQFQPTFSQNPLKVTASQLKLCKKMLSRKDHSSHLVYPHIDLINAAQSGNIALIDRSIKGMMSSPRKCTDSVSTEDYKRLYALTIAYGHTIPLTAKRKFNNLELNSLALEFSVQLGNLSVTRTLIDSNVSFNKQELLLLATTAGNVDTFNLIMGTKLNDSINLDTLLTSACKQDHKDIVIRLLAERAWDVVYVEEAFNAAASSNSINTVDYLLLNNYISEISMQKYSAYSSQVRSIIDLYFSDKPEDEQRFETMITPYRQALKERAEKEAARLATKKETAENNMQAETENEVKVKQEGP